MNSLSTQPAIDLIIGPMYASKSTELLRRLTIYHEMGMKVLYINSSKDGRSQNTFSTHNSTIGNLPFDTVKIEKLETVEPQKYEVIGIDEAQLFDNLKNIVVNWVDTLEKIVIVCGLNGDYKREPFGQILDLIPLCDSITKLEPFCLSCKKDKGVINSAHFTKRITDSKETVLIGGKDLYIPVCRKCYVGNKKTCKVFEEDNALQVIKERIETHYLSDRPISGVLAVSFHDTTSPEMRRNIKDILVKILPKTVSIRKGNHTFLANLHFEETSPTSTYFTTRSTYDSQAICEILKSIKKRVNKNIEPASIDFLYVKPLEFLQIQTELDENFY